MIQLNVPFRRYKMYQKKYGEDNEPWTLDDFLDEYLLAHSRSKLEFVAKRPQVERM